MKSIQEAIMKAPVLAATAALLLFSAPAFALQCDTDLAKIDAALSSNPLNISAELLAEAQEARDAGATLCAAGDEASAAEALGPAKFMLGL